MRWSLGFDRRGSDTCLRRRIRRFRRKCWKPGGRAMGRSDRTRGGRLPLSYVLRTMDVAENQVRTKS